MSGGQAEQSKLDTTHDIDAAIGKDQLVPTLQSFHVQRQPMTRTVTGPPASDITHIDTLEHCRYFITNGQATPPDEKKFMELQVLWDTGASHNFISKTWLDRYEKQFGTCPVVSRNVRYRIADSPVERHTYVVR